MPKHKGRVMPGPRRYTAAFAALAGAGMCACPAQAGPWIMPKGEGRVIVTIIYSHAGRSFDADSDAVNAPDYDQLMVFFAAEYGATDDITLVATPSLRRIEVENGNTSFGTETIEFGARWRLFHDDRWVVSAQATGFIPGNNRSDRVAQIGSNDAQYDARLQIGHGFSSGKLNGFSSIEGGYRFRSGDAPDEYHADATLGIHATKRLILIGNLFNTWSNGAGRGDYPSYRYSNLYAGGVLEVRPGLSFQLGALATVTGRNALRERGLYSGLWIKF